MKNEKLFGIAMAFKIITMTLLVLPLTLAACSKQDQAPASHESSASEVQAQQDVKITPEQQAAIDALDKPLQDEKNTDVPASVANAPADEVTASESQ